MRYRLGLDLGTNSIGWAAIRIDDSTDRSPLGLLDMGVWLFHNGRDPKTNASLAEPRRRARGMRRNRDRYLQRRAKLMNALIRYGLMPADESERKALESLDPYELRAQGVTEKITLHALGRALFHLNQRRGFRSNRKAERSSGEESGKVKTANKVLEEAITAAGARTLGQYLYGLHKDKKGVRARLLGEGAKAEYSLYPTRAMIEAEFDILWAEQKKYYPEHLTDAARNDLKETLFFQRDLKKPDVGRCRHMPEEDRAPKALPTSQRFRILKELNNLRIKQIGAKDRPLTLDQRHHLLKLMLNKKEVSFKKMRDSLGLDTDVRFNLENDRRDGLDGDLTTVRMSHKDAFGRSWFDLPLARQDEIIEKLLNDEDESALIAWLIRDCKLGPDAAAKVAGTLLPDGHMAFCKKLMDQLLPIMESGTDTDWTDPDSGEIILPPILEHTALARLGYHHTARRPVALVNRLPYYGVILADHVTGSGNPKDKQHRYYGSVTNPTVHIGLNQVRRVVNTLTKQYGKPAEIVVELARDLKLSQKEKERINKQQTDNQNANKTYDADLLAMGQPPSRDNRLRLRLREEQGGLCPYCGHAISPLMLFQSEAEIEHILPFRRTLDNSAANKVVAHTACNRIKGNRSPAEAFHGVEYEKILARAQTLPFNKRWRFDPDAMERYENKERDFLERQITDTQYLSKWAKEYLAHLVGDEQVWVTPGHLTSLLRGKWGLNNLLGDENRKNRDDHRHHAIDGLVIALTTRSMLHRIASASESDANRKRLIADMPEPWSGYRDHVRQRLETMIVAHRPDHGTQGRLHEDTAYGLVREQHLLDEGYNLVFRKPVTALTSGEVERIRDVTTREKLQNYIANHSGKWENLLKEFSESTGIKRVRLLKKEKSCVAIKDRKTQTPYKAVIPGNNHHVDIFATVDGEWKMAGVTVFEANQTETTEPWRTDNPGAKLIMRIHKGDMLETDVDGKRGIVRVMSLGPSINKNVGRLDVVLHSEGGDFAKRNKDDNDSFGWNGFRLLSTPRMQKTNTCRIRISPTGQVMRLPPLET